jgi:hypothetical protein
MEERPRAADDFATIRARMEELIMDERGVKPENPDCKDDTAADQPPSSSALSRQ